MGSLGDLGTILGSPSADTASDVTGVVTNVDTRNQSIALDVRYVNNLRPSSSTSNSNQTIYYDSNTRVMYQNNEYRVSDLERGDEISVRGVNDGGRYVAQTITVTRNARG